MWHRMKVGDVWQASSVGEAQQSVHSQKREANEREEELCWRRDALPKKYDGNGRRLYFDEQSLTYLSGERGVHVRCDLLCPGVFFCGPKCVA